MTRIRAIVLLLPLLLVTPAFAAELPTAKPGEVGLSSERLERLGQALRADVEKGRISGAVVLIARQGRVALVQTAGFRDPAARRASSISRRQFPSTYRNSAISKSDQMPSR